jgi:hypothetical protein
MGPENPGKTNYISNQNVQGDITILQYNNVPQTTRGFY